MAIGYKYAERDADSQVNWAEVGKGISDMLAETNRVRQEKKDALDTAQRETMKYLAETPNGEHVGARQSILEYANMASNQMRIMKQLMEQGQLDVKDYTIFRQNLTDNTNLAFNANKVFQEKYSDVMKGVADKKYSQLYADNYSEVQELGNWKNIGWQITPNGTVMSGKMVEEEIDGKKVRTLDKTPGGLRSMDYLNQALVSQVDFYNYEDKVNAWVETLGKEKTITEIDLGGIQRKGKITTKEDITSREDLSPGTKDVLYTFLQGENDQIASIVGEPLDAARVLVDSTIFAPNKKQYRTTTSEEDAKKNPEAILKVVDPETGGFKYVLSEDQQEDANEFVRGQMRSKYNYEESAEAIGATQRDESAMQKAAAEAAFREEEPTAPPVIINEPVTVIETNKKTGRKTIIDVTTKIENLKWQESSGVENVITDVGYNIKTGALVVKGYQVTGKESKSKKANESGVDVTTGASGTQQKWFTKNDLTSAPMVTSTVIRMPNPNRPGFNFRNVAEAKAYYKKLTESKTGEKPIRFDAQGNIIK